MEKQIKKIHFVGIGGSGISAVAALAKKIGNKVDGCNLDEDTDYLKILKNAHIKVSFGHDSRHIKNVDLVVVSPSVLYSNKEHPEVLEAQRRGILVTWEEFLGNYLHKGKEVIAISGTHGKSTTTALVGVLFETAKFEPMVVVGAKVPNWKTNFRFGVGEVFITEADEFNDNFLHYHPSVAVINNIEFDHPDYFKSENEVLRSFEKFVQQLTGKKTLVVNQDSPSVASLFKKLPRKFLDKLEVYGYTFHDEPLIKLAKSARVRITKQDKEKTLFSIKSDHLNVDNIFSLKIPGQHNVANAAGAIVVGKIYGIEDPMIQIALKKFKGIGRRLELIGEKGGVKIYDDYAHHPTAIGVTLSALRQKHTKARVWAVVEPHSYSRTKALLQNYKGIFDDADKVIITPIYKARDKETFGVTGESIVKASGHRDAMYLGSFEEIVKYLKKESKRGDIVLVMGAGRSYLLSHELLKNS